MTVKDVQHILDKMDKRMAMHSNNTACLCYAMAQYIGCPPKELEILWFAGLLLESGKIMQTNQFINTFEKPNDYIIYSTAVVNAIPGFKSVAKVLYQAEENVDGTGTPNHILGSDIDTLSKVLRIAAYYDDHRLDGMTHEEVCKLIREHADKFFPKKIITPFIKCIIKNELHTEYDKDKAE